MTPEEVLESEVKELEKDFLIAYKAKGMESSGDWGRSLETVVFGSSSGLSGSVKAFEYSQQLETGRKPGGYPPRDAIEDWIEEKGIAARIEGQISISSLAFLIARKIAREGWKREGYGGVELISEVATPQRMQSIIDKVGQSYAVLITSEVIKLFKDIEV